MKTNKQKRNFFRILVILWLIVLAVCLIMKFCGYEVLDWEFIVDSILLILCCIMYKNYDQAVKEDEKYGSQ